MGRTALNLIQNATDPSRGSLVFFDLAHLHGEWLADLIPAATAASTVAMHSSGLVSPHTTPMPPSPSVSAKTVQSLPRLLCGVTAAFPRRFGRSCPINAGPYPAPLGSF